MNATIKWKFALAVGWTSKKVRGAEVSREIEDSGYEMMPALVKVVVVEMEKGKL